MYIEIIMFYNKKVIFVRYKMKNLFKYLLCLISFFNFLQVQANDTIDVKINLPISLNHKTKNQIYDIRTNFVQNSIFKSEKYSPNEYVFGQIEDGKPWVSMNICRYNNEVRTVGKSEESRFIVNPSILIMLDYPFALNCKEGTIYSHDIPVQAEYSKEKNTLTVFYKNLKPTYSSLFYDLNGINAKDFGYNYLYIDKNKSSKNLIFNNKENNASDHIVEIQSFIHLGGSCGIEGGCNNGSPKQEDLEIKNSFNRHIVEQIYIKLWKNMPKSAEDTADFVEIIKIFPTNYPN